MKNVYRPLCFPDLMLRAEEIPLSYVNKKNNPNRSQILYFFNAIQSGVKTLAKNPDVSQELLTILSMGGWVYALEKIEAEYKHLSPYRSTLYTLLSEKIEISKENELSLHDKLIYLEKLYHAILASKDSVALTLSLKEEEITQLTNDLIDEMQLVLHKMGKEIKTMLQAIPIEKVIDKELMNLPVIYQNQKILSQAKSSFFFKKSENASRKFLTQLASGIGFLLKTKDETLADDMIHRNQNIKMGVLLYILYIINNEYYFRSPCHSDLYRLAKQALNIEYISDMKAEEQLSCLMALKNYLNNNEAIRQLEEYGQYHFHKDNLLKNLDIKLFDLQKELDPIIKGVDDKKHQTNWPATRAFSHFGSILFSAPGYGLGYVTGFTASETQNASYAKSHLSGGLHRVGTAYFATNSGGYFGFLVADFIIQSVLTRAFAKLFEQFGKLLGAATGGVVGLSVDLTYKGFYKACELFLDMHHHLGERIPIKNCDVELIKSLMRLPPQVFEEKNKLRLHAITKPDEALDEVLLERDNPHPFRP